MSFLAALHQKIVQQTARIGVIGLGYVGLPVACRFAEVGFTVNGVDIDTIRIERLNRGENPIEGIEPGLSELIQAVVDGGRLRVSTDYATLSEVEVVLISVQTPIDDSDHRPRYTHLQAALRAVGVVLPHGSLVIIESTLAPGTMTQVVIPTLESATGGQVGVDFFVGHCPERVTPGRLLLNLRTMSRVVGGSSPEVSAAMIALYRQTVQADLDPADLLTAEIVKTAENGYRDVQIAFANELALICEALGGDVWKVRELVNKSPGRQVLFPGAGVGGHCIPKDSWLLIANVGDTVHPALLPAARAVNRAMPAHVVALLLEALGVIGRPLSDAVIAVLGYAYMENSDDTRDTPTQAFLELITPHVGQVRIHDPYVRGYQGPIEATLRGVDAVVILVKHEAYVTYDWRGALEGLRGAALIDARRVLPDDFVELAAQQQVTLRVLGRGQHPQLLKEVQ